MDETPASRTVYVEQSSEAMRAIDNARFAVLLRRIGDDFSLEAARRLERIEIENGSAPCLAVDRSRVMFERLEPMRVTMKAADAPIRTERLEVVGLTPGESCAVDRFGDVLILYRAPQ